jgi:predicted ATPase
MGDMMEGPERPVPFISRVRLKNYKSIASCDVRLGPLTILIGPNGTGKSNFLDALAFLARALRTTPSEAIEERGGLSDILRRVPEHTDSFSMAIEFNVGHRLGSRERRRGSYEFEIARASPREKRAFDVIREECTLEWGDGLEHFEVDYGTIEDESGQPGLFVRVIEPDRLYLQIAGARKSFSRLYESLREVRSYSFGLDELRQPEPQSRRAVLGHRGEHLGDVLGALERDRPSYKERVDAYLRAIVPDVVGIEPWLAGTYASVMLRSAATHEGERILFPPNAMSDGTIRAAGVLAALFQPEVLDGQIPLVGIEEPEIALHPAAAGALFDALTEASEFVQVVATSQSPDLFDREDFDISTVRAVSMEHGLTTIGEVDKASRQIVDDKLYTLGELMRSSQITPEPHRNGDSPEPEA